MNIAAINRHYIYIPYKPPVDPYHGWKAASHGAHAVIIEMITDDGITGWGETAGREQTENHRQCSELMIGRDPLKINENVNFLKQNGCTNIAISGVEMAMWDILGKTAGLPLHALLGGKLRPTIDLCGLMGVKKPEDAADTAKLYCEEYGFGTIKTKSGRSADEDSRIIKAIRESVGDGIKIRSDANQNHTFENALALCNGAFKEYQIEYFEQPCDKDDLAVHSELRKLTGVPIALNESVTDSKSVARIIEEKAADYLVVDIPDAGGIIELIKNVVVAEASGIPCAFHNWHDLGVKTAAMAHIVSAYPIFKGASDTLYFGLVEDILTEPFMISAGTIAVPDNPGLGVEVNMDVINRYRKRTID